MSREMFRKCPIFAGMRSKHIEFSSLFGQALKGTGYPLGNAQGVLETL
jgi:hypothetical protein